MKKFSFIVAGAGGTGGYFLKEFARFMLGPDKERIDRNGLFILDGDIVEGKNVLRQCFLEEDIGLPKASCMADNLYLNFNQKWKGFQRYILCKQDVLSLFDRKKTIPVLVGAVDNHGCRMVLEEIFDELDDVIYLDSANEYESGEVVIAAKRKGVVLGPTRSFYFPEIRSGDVRNRDEMSCTELNEVAPQHIVTNMMAGNVLLTQVSRIFSGEFVPGLVMFNPFRSIMEFIPAPKEGVRNAV